MFKILITTCRMNSIHTSVEEFNTIQGAITACEIINSQTFSTAVTQRAIPLFHTEQQQHFNQGPFQQNLQGWCEQAEEGEY